MKYEYTEKCREISGFGGEYEEGCRNMVIAGMEWLDANPDAKPEFTQLEGVFGMTFQENEDMKNMQNHMNDEVGGGVTGAMMQASTNHVLAAKKLGWENYIKEMETERPEE